jgi:HSP20 family protein
MMTLRQAMDHLFGESAVLPPRLWRGGQTGAYLPVDVIGTDDAITIRAEVPGVNAEDMDISIQGSKVTIRGEVKAPTEGGSYLLQERRYGPFARTLELETPVQPEKAEAHFKDGILTLTIPKAEEVRPKVIKVKSQSTGR